MPSQVGASHRPGGEDAARGGWSRCRDRRPAGGGQPPAAAGVGPGDRRPRPGPVRPPGRCDQGGLGCRGLAHWRERTRSPRQPGPRRWPAADRGTRPGRFGPRLWPRRHPAAGGCAARRRSTRPVVLVGPAAPRASTPASWWSQWPSSRSTSRRRSTSAARTASATPSRLRAASRSRAAVRAASRSGRPAGPLIELCSYSWGQPSKPSLEDKH
jgi:hypothetical protein